MVSASGVWGVASRQPRVAPTEGIADRPGVRTPLIAAGVVVAVVALALPAGSIRLGVSDSFAPAMLTGIACVDVVSLWLLSAEFQDRGDRRILAMAAAYLWSLILMAGYAAAFPGGISSEPPLAVTPSVAPWMYVFWHGGFPALLGLAWAPWPGRLGPTAPAGRRRSSMMAVFGAVGGAAVVTVALLVAAARSLPVLIHGHDTTAMTRVTAPFVIPVVCAAVLATTRALRERSGPERWVFVATVACLGDLVLTYSAGYRYALGWYVGRSLTILAAAVVLVSMMAGFRRLKADAEFRAAHDQLTGLENRRSALGRLEGLVAEAAAGHGSGFAVVILDLDRFKRINDSFGHEAGDLVLRSVASVAPAVLRPSDVMARYGGEEFLILLPGSSAAAAADVADRVRREVEGLVVPGVGTVTTSLGVSSWRPGLGVVEVLRDADSALYSAKAAGRNRMAVWAA